MLRRASAVSTCSRRRAASHTEHLGSSGSRNARFPVSPPAWLPQSVRPCVPLFLARSPGQQDLVPFQLFDLVVGQPRDLREDFAVVLASVGGFTAHTGFLADEAPRRIRDVDDPVAPIGHMY